MRTLFRIATIAILAGCNSRGVADADSRVDCTLQGPRVDPNTVVLHLADTVRFSLLPAPACEGAEQSEAMLVSWASSDSLVVRVSASDGLARALALGRVTVTATNRRDSNVKTAAVVTVVP
jgi:uncharacterized protein YjdB